MFNRYQLSDVRTI